MSLLPLKLFSSSSWVWRVCQTKQKLMEGKCRLGKNSDSAVRMAVCAGDSSHRGPSQPLTTASKASQVCTRLIICIWEWYRLLTASTFWGQTTEPFLSLLTPPSPHPRRTFHCVTASHCVLPCYILQAPVNLCAFLIRSIWIVFAWKHLFSLSSKQDKMAKQTCTQCQQDAGVHADTVNAPVHKHIPVGSFESTNSCWRTFNLCKHSVSCISIKVSSEGKQLLLWRLLSCQSDDGSHNHVPVAHNSSRQMSPRIRRPGRFTPPSARQKPRRWHRVGLFTSALAETWVGSTWHLRWKIQPRPLLRRWQWEMSPECRAR